MSSEELTRTLWQPLDLSAFGHTDPVRSHPAPRVPPSTGLDVPVREVSGGRILGTIFATAVGGVGGGYAGAVVGLGPGDDDYIFGGVVGWLLGTTIGSAIGASAGSPDATFGAKLGRSTLTLAVGAGAFLLVDAMARESGAEDDAGLGLAMLAIPVGQIFAVLL